MPKDVVLFARCVVKKGLRTIAPRIRRRRPLRFHSIAYHIAGGMGDGIMCLPTIAFIKKQLPTALIDVFVPAPHRALLGVLLQPFHVVPTGMGNGRFLRYDAAFSNTVAAFRVGIELQGRLQARFSAGFRYPDEPPAARIFDVTLPLSDHEHDIDQNLSLVAQALGVDIEESDRGYPPLPPALLPPRSATPRAIVVHPGAGKGYAYKKWPFERYVALIRRCVAANHPVTVLLGPDDAHLYPFFSGLPGVMLRSTRRPEPLIATLRESRLFIGNDSGPAHCAALLGIPTITLFGPTSAARTAPRGNGCVAIEHALPCAPCHFSRSPCRDVRCLRSISVDEVWRAVEQALARDAT